MTSKLDYKPCLRCKGPTNIGSDSLLDVLCKNCTAGFRQQPVENTRPKIFGGVLWWRRG